MFGPAREPGNIVAARAGFDERAVDDQLAPAIERSSRLSLPSGPSNT